MKNNTIKWILISVASVVAMIIVFAVGFRFLINHQIENAMEWHYDEDITQEDAERYANKITISEISEYIECAAIRGIRDPEYMIETVPFSSVEELFAIIPFENEDDRQSAAKAVLENGLETVPDKIEPKEVLAVYYVPGLPIPDTDNIGSRHENYVVRREDGYRFVFFVQTM